MGQAENQAQYNQKRRQLLSKSLSATVALSLSTIASNSFASALTAPIFEPDRSLKLVNIHTWEELDVVYWSQGHYIADSLNQINHLMRDHRANESIDMDHKLLDDLHYLYSLLGTQKRIQVLSAYRTRATNARLRKRSRGVAKFSLHMEGRAVDISVPDRSAAEVRSAALSMQAGGVGYYASSGFVHIDTGNVRNWDRS